MNKKYYLLWLNDNNNALLEDGKSVDCYFGNLFCEDYPGNNKYTIPKRGAIIGYSDVSLNDSNNDKFEIIRELFTGIIVEYAPKNTNPLNMPLSYYYKSELIPDIVRFGLSNWGSEEVSKEYKRIILSLLENKLGIEKNSIKKKVNKR